MYNGIGILTTRGTGTSGHVQANKFNLRRAPIPKFQEGKPAGVPAADKKPDKGILEHNRKRQVEVKLLKLQDELEAQGWAACDLRSVCRFGHACL
jgi:serine/arginine repetitive matrix protein 2